MKYTTLGKTDISVSKICLGTMTFGEQNTEAEGHEQLDYAIEQGVNFVDTAEMYSVPGSKETQGSTERIIGSWMQARKNREDLVLATKVTGPSKGLSYIRNVPNFSKSHILEAIEGSLDRLQTDYVDLYQLHWPERQTNFFGQIEYNHNPNDQWEDNLESVLETMSSLVKAGKVRQIGISNETPWGMHRYLHLAEKHGFSRVVSNQNPYSLLNRSYEVGLAEMSIREDVGLLAYSPLAMGALSGKYLNGARPEEGRLVKFPAFARYLNDYGLEATAKYKALADDLGLTLPQLALAFVTDRPFVTTNIIGATSMDQLKDNLSSASVELSAETLKEINQIHRACPNPAP